MGAPGHLVVHSVVELEAALTSDDRPSAQLVHYFGTRCPGCKTMHPKLLQLQKKYQGISFIMVRAFFLASSFLVADDIQWSACLCAAATPTGAATVTATAYFQKRQPAQTRQPAHICDYRISRRYTRMLTTR
jgi:thiol-disulfide isomerase/thioredoxin